MNQIHGLSRTSHPSQSNFMMLTCSTPSQYRSLGIEVTHHSSCEPLFTRRSSLLTSMDAPTLWNVTLGCNLEGCGTSREKQKQNFSNRCKYCNNYNNSTLACWVTSETSTIPSFGKSLIKTGIIIDPKREKCALFFYWWRRSAQRMPTRKLN
jgi:hypothetical protein